MGLVWQYPGFLGLTKAPRIISGQITIIPKPELRGFGGYSLTKPPFGMTSAEVAIICPDYLDFFKQMLFLSDFCNSWGLDPM